MKINREIRRIGDQFLEPFRQVRDTILRLDYRIRHDHHVRHFQGQITWTDRIAIFLVHQPARVTHSVFATCDHLHQQGYACVLVSNGDLNVEDLNRFLTKVAHVIVRPNFGYDFGGYQEAVIWLRKRGRDLRYLLLMNDSVWFPVLKSESFVRNMENAEADVVGALSAQRGVSQRHQRKLFFASFMLLFSDKVWHSAKFENFWKNYRQTSSKPRTIRKGERILSALFIHDKEFTHHAMVDHNTYKLLSRELTIATWPKFANELAVFDANGEKKRDELLANTGSNVEEAWCDWYSGLIQSQNMFTCAQTPLVLRAGVPFIKKSTDHQNMLMLQQAITTFQAEPSFDLLILDEIKAKVSKYFENL